MSQAGKRVIAVFGATGAQGGSVLRSLVDYAKDDFTVRAVTRNIESAKAKALAEIKDVEVVQADQHDPESVAKAIEGAYGVFCLTNFWDPSTQGKEVLLGRNVINAALAANVTHFVFSGLPNAWILSEHKYSVDHFTAKAEVVEFARRAGFRFFTNVEPACYMQNFTSILAPRQIDGKEVLTVPMSPDKKLDLIDITKYGIPVVAAFKDPEAFNNVDVLVQTDRLTPREIAAAFSEVKQVPVELKTIDPSGAEYKAMVNEEMSQMFAWFDEFGYFGPTAEWKRETGKDAVRKVVAAKARADGADDATVAQKVSSVLKDGTMVETLKRELPK